VRRRVRRTERGRASMVPARTVVDSALIAWRTEAPEHGLTVVALTPSPRAARVQM